MLDGEDLRQSMLNMLEDVVASTVADVLSNYGGQMQAEELDQLLMHFEGTYFAKGSFTTPKKLDVEHLTDAIYQCALEAYEQKEAALTPSVMRELERVIMLRVVDEYWMDNIDAMDDLKQGIGLRAYGQHDPVVAYKEEGYQMFQAMITAIREETVRRLFLARIQPQQEVKRVKVAKETGNSASDKTVKQQPVRNKDKKVGPNDPCPCGSGKKYKKCCLQKEKAKE